MNTTLELVDFFAGKKILHFEDSKNFNDALKFFIKNESNCDIVTYNHINSILLFNIAVLEINNEGQCYYDFIITREGDMIDNIFIEKSPNLNIEISYHIGGIKYTPEEVKQFIFAAAQYHEFKIRITFIENPTIYDKINIISRRYLFNKQDRKYLATSMIRTKNNDYMNGMCVKRDT